LLDHRVLRIGREFEVFREVGGSDLAVEFGGEAGFEGKGEEKGGEWEEESGGWALRRRDGVLESRVFFY
jgi:hypothetical protein